MTGTRLLALAAMAAGFGIQASATIVIDFAGAAGGAFTGSATTFNTTTPIMIDMVMSLCTGADAALCAHPGVHSVTGGGLTIAATGGSFAAGVYTYTGGSFSISGAVPDVPLGVSTLLSGTISSLKYDTTTGAITIGTVNGTDSKNPTLVSYLCPTCSASGWLFGPGTFRGTIVGGGGGTYSSTSVFSIDIPNQGFVATGPVPEPAAVVLLGSALVGMAYALRRRSLKS
jgi:PEP-CTERM motif